MQKFLFLKGTYYEKKFMSVMLAATLVVSLVGCGKKNNNNTATDADDTSNKAITAEGI